MNRSHIVFMGTSEFAVPVLYALLRNGCSIKIVYTSPDGLGGRGQKTIFSPVKKASLDCSLPVRQPVSLRNREEQEYLKRLNPDIIIVAAYGLILPGEVLNLPPLKCINIHPSLLPEHRGPSPIHSAILAGDKESGVSIMVMDEGVDTGPVLKQQKYPIGFDDTTETLTHKLAELGGSMLVSLLPDWFEGKIILVPQDNSRATYSKIIKKGDGEIDWQNNTAEEIWLKIRAFYPWPGSYTLWKGKLLKILRAAPMEHREPPGQVVEVKLKGETGKKIVGIGAKEGTLEIKMVQYEGKRAMTAEEFARGHRDFIGSRLPD